MDAESAGSDSCQIQRIGIDLRMSIQFQKGKLNFSQSYAGSTRSLFPLHLYQEASRPRFVAQRRSGVMIRARYETCAKTEGYHSSIGMYLLEAQLC
jgi:hypothetical protein